MKNIKYIAILVFQFALVQFTFAQAPVDNGRPVDSNPGPIVKTETPVPKDVPNTGSHIVDLDVAGKLNNQDAEQKEDTYYPIQLKMIEDEIEENDKSAEMTQKVEELTSLVDNLLRISEELRLENKVIRESLNNCCSINSLGLTAKDAYLLQNAPTNSGSS